MFIYSLSSDTTRINNNDRLNSVIRCNSPLKNSFKLHLFYFFSFFPLFSDSHQRSADEGGKWGLSRKQQTEQRALGNGPLNRPLSDNISILRSDGALLLLSRTTWLPDIIEPQELVSTAIADSDYNYNCARIARHCIYRFIVLSFMLLLCYNFNYVTFTLPPVLFTTSRCIFLENFRFTIYSIYYIYLE